MLELHVIAGPAFGSIFRMEGVSAVLGADPSTAQWAVFGDITLAPRHCEFSAEDGGFSVAPIGVATIAVNGVSIKQRVSIRSGDLLSTGASVFSVQAPEVTPKLTPSAVVAEVDTPPPLTPLPSEPARTEAPDAVAYIAYTRIDDRPPVTAFLAGRPANLYAVVDSARSPIVYPLLQQCGEEHVPLFTLDGMPEDLKAYAPYLARLSPKSVLLQQLVLQGWADHWCVYLSTPLDFEGLRVHLKKFLMVRLDDGREVFFRFYDPRVLRVFLPACTSDEASRFFGDIAAWYCSDAQGACLEFLLEKGARGPGSLLTRQHQF